MKLEIPHNQTRFRRSSGSRSGFTLVELLIVISIIGVLTSMVVVALADSANSAKKSRAQVQIRKINDLIMDQWESFETRSIPLRLNTTAFPQLRNPRNASRLRLYAIRELMQKESKLRV
jgi:prepilin-type N-terminal cleavage/methylation domain-containing protein